MSLGNWNWKKGGIRFTIVVSIAVFIAGATFLEYDFATTIFFTVGVWAVYAAVVFVIRGLKG